MQHTKSIESVSAIDEKTTTANKRQTMIIGSINRNRNHSPISGNELANKHA